RRRSRRAGEGSFEFSHSFRGVGGEGTEGVRVRRLCIPLALSPRTLATPWAAWETPVRIPPALLLNKSEIFFSVQTREVRKFSLKGKQRSKIRGNGCGPANVQPARRGFPGGLIREDCQENGQHRSRAHRH